MNQTIWVELLLDKDNEKFLQDYLMNIVGYAFGLVCIGHRITPAALKILKQAPLPVVLHEYRDEFHEGLMRSKALELAKEQKADYILIQDADEQMSEQFCKEIVEYLSQPNPPNCITCPWVNFWNTKNKVRVDGYWFPEWRRRIKVMKTDKVLRRPMGKVHYGPVIEEGNKFDSKWFCKHYGYMYEMDRIRKNGRWQDSGIKFFADYSYHVGGVPVLMDWIEEETYENFLSRAKATLNG